MYAVKSRPRKRRNIPLNLVKPSKQQKRIKVDHVSGTLPQASVSRIQPCLVESSQAELGLEAFGDISDNDILSEKKKQLQSGMKFIKLL